MGVTAHPGFVVSIMSTRCHSLAAEPRTEAEGCAVDSVETVWLNSNVHRQDLQTALANCSHCHHVKSVTVLGREGIKCVIRT